MCMFHSGLDFRWQPAHFGPFASSACLTHSTCCNHASSGRDAPANLVVHSQQQDRQLNCIMSLRSRRPVGRLRGGPARRRRRRTHRAHQLSGGALMASWFADPLFGPHYEAPAPPEGQQVEHLGSPTAPTSFRAALEHSDAGKNAPASRRARSRPYSFGESPTPRLAPAARCRWSKRTQGSRTIRRSSGWAR